MNVKLGLLGLNLVKIVNLFEIKYSFMLLRIVLIWNFLSFRKNGMIEVSVNILKDVDLILIFVNLKCRDFFC